MESTMAFAIRNSKQPMSKHQELDDTEETLTIADDQLGFQNQITNLQNQMLDLNMEDVQAGQSQDERTQKSLEKSFCTRNDAISKLKTH